jgi:hypothetical protein
VFTRSPVTRKSQLIKRITEMSRLLGSDVVESFYEDYETDALEIELELLENLLDEELDL